MAVRRLLHILKTADPFALDVIRTQAATEDVVVILIQQATHQAVALPVPVFVLREDVTGPTPHPHIGYPEMLDHILWADVVMSW